MAKKKDIKIYVQEDNIKWTHGNYARKNGGITNA
jgi:hypothetical protein